ncbi:MAG: hypothetical protein ACFB02_20370 [Mastigocoleus sp.]
MLHATINNQKQNYLLNLLKLVEQNQPIQNLLKQNLDLLDTELIAIFKGITARLFRIEPQKAVNRAKIIAKFSDIIGEFKQGNIKTNIDIAIAGYEIALTAIDYRSQPKFWNKIQQSLVKAYIKQLKISEEIQFENYVLTPKIHLKNKKICPKR